MSTNSIPPDPSQVRPAWYWIKDTRGYGSVTVTMVFIAFWVTTISYVVSFFETLGPLSTRPFDIGACSTYFIPILTLYLGRKYTDAKFSLPSADPEATAKSPDKE